VFCAACDFSSFNLDFIGGGQADHDAHFAGSRSARAGLGHWQNSGAEQQAAALVCSWHCGEFSSSELSQYA